MGKLDQKTGGIKSPESAQRSPTQTSEERRYRAEENLRTASKYHEMATDRDALKDVQALAVKQMATLAKVAGKADGASTRSFDKSSGGSSPDKRTNTNPPKAASKGGSSGGGARNMGRASQTSKTSK
jgi:hypothetical protein